MFMEWFRNKYPYTDFHELNFDLFITEFKSFIESLGQIDNWIDEHEKEYEELKNLYDDLLAGRFTPQFLATLNRWVTENAVSIIDGAIKTVFFGLEDGYLVAYVPDSWSEIIFGTSGLDDFPYGYDFGHLTLRY